jgi:hypothetical protein
MYSIRSRFGLPSSEAIKADSVAADAVSSSRLVALIEPLRSHEESHAFRALQADLVTELGIPMPAALAVSLLDDLLDFTSGVREEGVLSMAPTPRPTVREEGVLTMAPTPRPVMPVNPSSVPTPPAPVVLPVPEHVLVRDVVDAARSLIATLSVLGRELEGCDDPNLSAWDCTALGHNLYHLLRNPELGELLEVDAMLSLAETEGAISVQVTETARAVIAAAQSVAAELLPDFISDVYSLFIEPAIPSFTTGSPLQIGLARNDGRARFPLAEAAEGHRLWVQLAVLEAADALRIHEAGLWLLAMAVINCADQHEEIEQEESGEEDEGARSFELEDAESALLMAVKELVGDYREISEQVSLAERAPAVSQVPRTVWEQVEPPLRTRIRRMRQRFYIIDEPERHLHPRLQREAARWLAGTMRERRSQCLISTHAVPFMNLGGGTTYVSLRRGERGRTTIDVFQPELLTALDEFAADLGLNRGELLATRNLILFVEGRADQKVLEALYLKRFYEAGIAVVPLHGAHHAKAQARDSEILLRYSRAKVAVLLDELSIEELVRLKSDEQFLQQALRSRKQTLRDMANLLKTAREYGHADVEPFGIPGNDIFAMLDEEIVREMFPSFPGHANAMAEWNESGRGIGWKDYYEEEYSVPKGIETLYVPVADRMREESRIPKALNDVIDEVVRYAILGSSPRESSPPNGA